ncbi:amidase [Cytobacillus firmus]|uniref:amidase n=1 Tax=Cytobacillus firmus TaxID=1399 RepID=UPI00222849BE|nr:amidase [Cytobacillus firmus]
MGKDICFDSARNLAKAIQDRELSVREVMEAHLSQIQRVNPKVNAIVSLNEELALKEADKADKMLDTGKPAGPFHGLPIAIKDTHNAVGFPATSGSLIYRDNYPNADDMIVERLRKAGAIVIGKTNVPEFAAGSHTFNKLFGATRNPYDLSKSAGGSSGGAAAAVASGMIPFADGSDMGGSLRNPASFNNVVGLRTSPGRIPLSRTALYSPLAVQGPITRNVDDAFFMLSVIAGPDGQSPLSIEEPGSRFLEPVQLDIKGLRIAYSPDFGGLLPVDPEVRSNLEEQVKVFEDLGCIVEEECPDLTEADEVFQVLRAWEFELSYSEIFERYREMIKPSVIWNIEKGRSLSGPDLGRAERLRALLYNRMSEFFKQYDALILPVSQVTAFDVNIEYPTEINGVKMGNYIDWMRSCYYISAAGNPSVSIPSGFTAEGIPIGLQIVGPHRADFEVLRIGRAFEQATGYGKRRPDIALGQKIN